MGMRWYVMVLVFIYLVGCCGSVSKSCPTLCDSMDCTMPGIPVFHYFLNFPQTQVHWVGDAIQPSYLVAPFSSCPQSFPASGSFPMSQLFASGGQIIGVSSSASVLPLNIQGWFPLGLTGLISLQSKRFSRVFSSTTVRKPQFSEPALTFFLVQLLHLYMTTGKTTALFIRTFVGKVMFLVLQRPNYIFTNCMENWCPNPSIVQGSTVLYKRQTRK